MITRRVGFAFGLVMFGAAATPTPGAAQRVSADIRLGSGPIVGTIRIGDRPYYRMYGRPRRAYAEAVYPVRVAVERRHGWNRRRDNGRLVVVFYDRDCDLYFDRYHRGLEEVRVFQDEGRYYRYDDYNEGRRDDRWGRKGHDRDRDRDWDRDDRRGEKGRDWYYERNGRDDDDRWEHDHQH